MQDVVLFGLTGGEAFIVIFVTAAIVSAPWWPRAGARLMGVKGSVDPTSTTTPSDD